MDNEAGLTQQMSPTRLVVADEAAGEGEKVISEAELQNRKILRRLIVEIADMVAIIIEYKKLKDKIASCKVNGNDADSDGKGRLWRAAPNVELESALHCQDGIAIATGNHQSSFTTLLRAKRECSQKSVAK